MQGAALTVMLRVMLTAVLTAMLAMQTIPGRDDVISTAAEWVQDRQSGQWRLLTGGVDGMLVEWDLHTLLPKASSPSYGGASWALAVQPQQSDKPNTGMPHLEAGATSSPTPKLMLPLRLYSLCVSFPCLPHVESWLP